MDGDRHYFPILHVQVLSHDYSDFLLCRLQAQILLQCPLDMICRVHEDIQLIHIKDFLLYHLPLLHLFLAQVYHVFKECTVFLGFLAKDTDRSCGDMMGCCHLSLQSVLHNNLMHNVDLFTECKVASSIGSSRRSKLGCILMVVLCKAPLMIASCGSSREHLLDSILHLQWQHKMALTLVVLLLDTPAGIGGVGKLGSAQHTSIVA